MMRILAAALIAVAACGGNSRDDQCRKWKTEFNRATRIVTSGSVNTAEDAARAVKEMESVKSALAAIQIDDDKLKELQSQYVSVAGKKIANMQAAQSAAANSDKAAWDAMARDADADDQEEDAITARVVAYCKF
jgi:hypothetical protein